MNSTIQLDPHTLQILGQILHNHLPKNTEIWLFGSRASNTAKKYSDIDLAINAKTKLPFATLAALASDFEESDLPYKVDVVDLNDIEANFRHIIDQNKVLLKF